MWLFSWLQNTNIFVSFHEIVNLKNAVPWGKLQHSDGYDYSATKQIATANFPFGKTEPQYAFLPPACVYTQSRDCKYTIKKCRMQEKWKIFLREASEKEVLERFSLIDVTAMPYL